MAGGRYLFLAISSELTFFGLWAHDITPWLIRDFLDFTHWHHEWAMVLLLPVIVGSWYIWWRRNKRQAT